MIFQTIVYILLFLLIIIFLIDFIHLGTDWFLRIKMGRFDNHTSWNQIISDKGREWLNHTPKIRVTDNTRFILLDILKRNYSNNTIQQWQEAALLLGLAESLKNKDNVKLQEEIKTCIERNFDKEGQWRKRPLHVDGAILAFAIMKLDFIDIDKYRPALDYTWDLIEEHIGDDGTVQYRKSMTNYRYVDTIGFICPFLIAYGLRYQNEKCIDLAYKQIKEFEKHGLLKEFYLPCHAYDINQKLPLGLYGWGRGLGWFAIGLIDAWKELPNTHKYKKELENLVVNFAYTLRKFQHENGSWNWTVTRNKSRADSSTTATLSWFLLNTDGIKGSEGENWAAAERAINYLQKVTRRNGGIDFSQGDTKDIGVYSSLFNIMPFTQGFAIRSINLFLRKVEAESDTFKNVS
jgi:unsaturated rhamnogalacturonyl hydrolase